MMNEHIKHYLRSLKAGSIHAYSLLVDLLYVGFITLITTGAARMATEQGLRIINAVPGKDLQQYVLSLPPEEMELFYIQIRNFVIQYVAAFILIPILALLLYSLSNALIWNRINKTSLTKKNYWRWNGLYLAMPLFMILFAIAFIITRYILQYLPFSPELIHGITLLIFLTAFLIFLFTVSFFFVKEYKVFQSIGHALHYLKTHKKRTLIQYAFALTTILILQLIQLPFRVYYFIYPTRALVIQVIILLVYLAWLRVYVAEQITTQ
jgi:hypothetical protein